MSTALIADGIVNEELCAGKHSLSADFEVLVVEVRECCILDELVEYMSCQVSENGQNREFSPEKSKVPRTVRASAIVSGGVADEPRSGSLTAEKTPLRGGGAPIGLYGRPVKIAEMVCNKRSLL